MLKRWQSYVNFIVFFTSSDPNFIRALNHALPRCSSGGQSCVNFYRVFYEQRSKFYARAQSCHYPLPSLYLITSCMWRSRNSMRIKYTLRIELICRLQLELPRCARGKCDSPSRVTRGRALPNSEIAGTGGRAGAIPAAGHDTSGGTHHDNHEAHASRLCCSTDRNKQHASS
jgi:hypothetical protein